MRNERDPARLFSLGLGTLLVIVGVVLLFLLGLAWAEVIDVDRTDFGRKTVEMIALGGGFIIAGTVIVLLTRILDRLDMLLGQPKL